MIGFGDLRVGVKQLSVLGAALAAVVVVGWTGLRGVEQLAVLGGEMYSGRLVPIRGLSVAKESLQEMEVLVQSMALTRDAAQRQRWSVKLELSARQFGEGLDAYSRGSLGPEEVAGLAKVREEWEHIKRVRDSVVALLVQGKDQDAAALIDREFRVRSDSAVGTVSNLIEVNVREARALLHSNLGTEQEIQKRIQTMAVVAVFLLGAFGFVVARSITVPVLALGDAARKLAVGEVDVSLIEARGDEIGDLTRSFAEMVSRTRTMAFAAARLADGDTTVQVDPRSENDVLAKSMLRVVGSVKGLVEDVQALTRAASEGRLQIRGRPDTYHGSFRQVLEGINGMLDAVIGPLHVAAGCVERISKGDIPPLISERFGGEFDVLRDNLNALIEASNAVAAAARAISDGDLTTEVRVRSARDEFVRAFREMVHQLRSLVGGIQRVAAQLSVSSNEILAASSQREKVIAQQTVAVDETTGAMAKLGTSQTEMVARTQAIEQTLERTLAEVQEGRKHVDDTARCLQAIEQKSQATSERIGQLSAKVQQISKIVTTIREITEQINLLALNAAIEAARAGEQGRGFAVVATEVRRLAERTDRSTDEIVELIEGIQAATHTTVVSNEENLRTVASGVTSVAETVSVFGSIQSTSEGLSDGIEQVFLWIRSEQATFSRIEASIREINAGMSQILAGTKETVSSARDLRATADRLREQAGFFKLGNAPEFPGVPFPDGIQLANGRGGGRPSQG